MQEFSEKTPLFDVLALKDEDEDLDFISDGVYDVTGMPVCSLPHIINVGDPIGKEGLAFVQEHGPEGLLCASAYEVDGIILIKGTPVKLDRKIIGSIGVGACGIIQNCPESILIIAQND
jgi:hypothetical protein